MHEQTAIAWLEEKKRKYLYGLDRQTTIVALGSALFLIVYLTYSRRSFFRVHFGNHLGGHPLWELFSYYYWFLTSSVTLMLLPALVAKFGTKCRIRDYGFRLSHGKLGWGLAVGVWALMIPCIILALQVFPAFQDRYPLCKIAGSRGNFSSRMSLRMASICSPGNFSFEVLCYSGWNGSLATLAS